MNNAAEQEVLKGETAGQAAKGFPFAFNMLADLGSSKQFSITGGMPAGTSEEDWNAEVDKVRRVFDRQQAKSAVLTVSQELEGMENSLVNMKADIARIDGKYSEKGGMSSAERNNRENAVVTMSGLMKKIEQHKALLVKLKEDAK